MKPIRPILLLTLALAATPALAQQDLDEISRDITARAGQSYGSLETVSGDIRIEAGARTRSASTVSGDIHVAQDATTGGLETVSGDIHAGGKVSADGDVESVSGDIFFDRGGSVRGDVDSVSGDIGLVGTRVGGGLETVSGDITVGVGSHVRGGIKIEKNENGSSMQWGHPPRIVIGPNAVVEGPMVFERPVVLYVHKTAKIGRVSGATAKIFDTPTAPKD
ncbi:MAG TPA: DUF4097 family beta strand repeat-containing protein [Pseudoxanthomonas sp.]|nr:DUF4097 family beta strand repeat-containing protein [Pseudoxanthomonas sp.]